MTASILTTLRINIIKFCIGCLLLGINYYHAQARPVEWETLSSSLGVLVSKIVYIWHEQQGLGTSYLQRQEYIKQAQELRLSIRTSCFPEEEKKVLDDTITTMRHTSVQDFGRQLFYFANILTQTKDLLDQNCLMINQTTTHTIN
ncbi:MAG: hypothetical protein NZL83_04165 [Candidatus Absconditabacterales bacterium]|nr:hypothetical protein [Candidatus Absconditabacterales bacterium]